MNIRIDNPLWTIEDIINRTELTARRIVDFIFEN